MTALAWTAYAVLILTASTALYICRAKPHQPTPDDIRWAALARQTLEEAATSNSGIILVGCFIGTPGKDLTADVQRAWQEMKAQDEAQARDEQRAREVAA